MARRLAIIVAVGGAVLTGRGTEATVLVPMSDAALVAGADVVVTGVVERTDVVGDDRGAVESRAVVRVVDTLKGTPARTRLLVRQPGGRAGERVVHVFGTAPLQAGDTVLLFARRRPGGGHRPFGMALGAFRLSLDDTGEAVAASMAAPQLNRPLAAFAARITELAGGQARRLRVDPTPTTDPFTLLGSPPGRWFDFDLGRTVTIRTANGDADIGRRGSDELVTEAFAAWTAVESATARLRVGGDAASGPSIAGGVCDGESVVQFNDPADELDDLQGCTGVLAVGGFCGGPTAVGPGGIVFARIDEGDVTVNRRFSACFDPKGLAEVLTHETGHLLGLGHSSERAAEPNAVLRDATMFYLAHFDGRGASLRADDVAGISAVYPEDDDDDGIPDEFDRCPGTPAGHPADETGCACVDPGHVLCPAATRCTISRCDFESARCVVEPIDCTGGDPCLTGTCSLDVGCVLAPVTGFDAISCALERDFAPAVCDDDRIPRAYRRRVRRARRRVERARRAAPARQERLLARAGRLLDRAVERLARAADPGRRRPLSPACATALTNLAIDARVRIETGAVASLLAPPS